MASSEIVSIAFPVSIRDSGYDEYWLQDQIWSNPAILGLGELEGLSRERKQNSGGRLDILLKDPQEDYMYEVEVMLGETDETHIIRTIEYWDNEKRRWPQRQHFAVLVAEQITRRFFNVIHILSHSIPIIAIQASLLEIEGKKSLFFTKVLDTFEEVDDGLGLQEDEVNRDYWSKRASWTLESAELLLQMVKKALPNAEINFRKNYIGIVVGRNNYFSLHKRTNDKSLIRFRVAAHLTDETTEQLDLANMTFTKKPKAFVFTVDERTLREHQTLIEGLSLLAKRTWDKEA